MYEYIDPTSEFADDEVTYKDKLSYKIKAPMQMGFGVAMGREGDGVAVDIVYENWKQAKLRYPSNYIPEPNYFRDRYRSSLSWRLGAEKKLPVADIVGRIGYFRQPLLFKGPRGYDAGAARIDVSDNRDFLTFGIGKQFDPSLRLDAAYIRGVWSQKESPRQDEETRNQVFVSMTYRWNMAE